ncbi:MAG: DUF5989 family protein [Pirellulales bacterium]
MSPSETPPDSQNRFVDEASRKRPGLLREFVDFLRHNKKWWLAPIIVMLLLLGVIVILGGTAAAPFIYPLL